MKNNEILQQLRTLLKIEAPQFIELLASTGINVTPDEMTAWLKPAGEAGHAEFSNKLLINLLNAIVLSKRGPDKSDTPRPIENTLTNNLVLKKLRVAFELKENDLEAIAAKTQSRITPQEWSSYFRKPDHKNYRECPDEFLLSIFQGLAS